MTDLTAVLRDDVTAHVVNEVFRAAAAEAPLAGVLVYSEEPIVSSDIVGSPASCTFDAPLTLAMGNLVKVMGWYDNEWGYTGRLVDLIARVGARAGN
jgi:glyceraldehyde 3-phosphate dehydrogenase